LKAFWQPWQEKISTLQQRERWMVFLAGLAIIYFVLDTFLVSPTQKRHALFTAQVAQSRLELEALQQQIHTLKATPLQDVNAGNQAKITRLNATILDQTLALQAVKEALVSPMLMPEMLENLMRRHAEIRLVNMKTLPPINFIRADAPTTTGPMQAQPTGQANEIGVYQHGLELTLSGHYMALMRYAESLQGLSQQVWWDKAELVTKDYPESELTVTVYTLSLDKTWLTL